MPNAPTCPSCGARGALGNPLLNQPDGSLLCLQCAKAFGSIIRPLDFTEVASRWALQEYAEARLRRLLAEPKRFVDIVAC